MQILAFLLALCAAFQQIHSLPVITQPTTSTEAPKPEPDSPIENLENIIEYERYLKEVVNALESDPQFREKLNNAQESDIRTGKIAQELEYVNHHVRNKLDELKRQELQRLRDLARQEFELTNNIDRDQLKIGHLDHENQHTFEIDDLRKLILKTSSDLAEADRRRREDFKQYELQKEFEKQEQLRILDEEHKKKYEEDLKKQQQKHDKHEKIHHPGNKAQLEEVWEKQDHMDSQDFDPKTFFMLHDLDGNGYWDENEVKVLFINELNKVYQEGMPEDDMKERAEEMERMREHVFNEADTNKDKLISFQEFVEQTKRDEFNKDPEWQTVDHQPQFTHEEYLEFERRRQEEIKRLVAEGKLPAHPNMPNGYYPGGPNDHYQAQHPNQVPQYHPNQAQHPNQVPQYHPNQGIPPNNQVPQYHPNQGIPPNNQVPQYHPNQVMPPQHGAYPQNNNQGPQYLNQVNPQQYQPNNQVPQQNYQYQQPQKVETHPNQVYEHVPQQQAPQPKQQQQAPQPNPQPSQSGQQSNQYQQPANPPQAKPESIVPKVEATPQVQKPNPPSQQQQAGKK